MKIKSLLLLSLLIITVPLHSMQWPKLSWKNVGIGLAVTTAIAWIIYKMPKTWDYDSGIKLKELVERNDLRGVKTLCAQYAPKTMRNYEYETSKALLHAIKYNQVEMAEFLIATFGNNITSGLNLIYYNAAKEDIDPKILRSIVQQLKKQYPENWKQQLTYQGISEALGKEDAQYVIQKLVDAGADVNAGTSTVLHRAGELALQKPLENNNYLSAVKVLLANGARTDIKDYNGKTVVDLCNAKGMHADTLFKLRELIYPTKEMNTIHETAKLPVSVARMITNYAFADDQELLITCKKGFDRDPTAQRVAHLLESGCKPNITNNNGKSCLHYAAQHGNEPAVQCLLKHDAHTLMNDPKNAALRIPLCDINGTTPLHLAAESGSVEVGALLIRATPAEYRKALINAKTNYTTPSRPRGRFRFRGEPTTQQRAANQYRYSPVTKKPEYVKEEANTTPLMLAQKNGHDAFVKLLQQYGAE